jgi:tetratricopeptide (TPR) repeat protein
MNPDRDSSSALYRQAQDALGQKQYQSARTLFLKVLEETPDHPDSHYGLATCCFLQGDFLGAAHHFKEVTRYDPLRAGAFINLGAIYNRLGRYEEAITILRRGIQLDPTRGEGYYNLGLVHRQMEHWDLAVDSYREAVRINPKLSEAHFNLANLLLELEKFANAIAHYKHALKDRPSWPEAKQGLEMAEEAYAEEGSARRQRLQRAANAAPQPRTVSESVDPSRLVDPTIHREALVELSKLATQANHLGAELNTQILKQLEGAIKELSANLLKSDLPPLELEKSLANFTAAMQFLQGSQRKLRDLKGKFQVTRESIG